MTNKIFIEFFERDLDKLSAEIQLYKSENDLWKTGGSIHNTAGNLALHIIGNLNHFIGMVLGGTGYERERDKEFSNRDMPREELLKGLSETKAMVLNVLPGISDAMMMEDYPFEFIKGKEAVSTAYVLTQLILHLDYHLGQVNYHRRLLAM